MARIKKLQESGATIYPATIMNAVKDTDSQQTLPEVLDDLKEGNHPKMSVGFAENIVGDGTATEEEFSFRPTAGVNRNVETTTYDYDMRSNFAARIESVKGNSVVYNQLFDKNPSDRSYDNNGVHIVDNLDGSYTIWTDDGGATAQVSRALSVTHNFSYSGNKLLITGCEGAKENFGFWDGFSNTIGTNFSNNRIITALGNGTVAYSVIIQSGVVISRTKWRPKVHNLTQMFGAGNEPTTVEEFYARLPIGVDLNAYNEGEMVDANYGAIKTTGFNQWDEQWRQGYYNSNNGGFMQGTTSICNANPIRVISGVNYRVNVDNNVYAFFYDQEMQFISYTNMRRTKTLVPQGAVYMNFYVESAYGATYKNDICLNLAWGEYASLNGTYAPYKPFERDLSWISKYFTEGKMRRAGSVSDEFRFNSTTQKWEAVHRVGVVDLGTLSWSIRTTAETGKYSWGAVLSTPSVTPDVIANITCQKYVAGTANDVYLLKDKTIAILSNALGIAVNIYDSMYVDSTSLNSFVESLQGVMLNYELVEPIVTEIEEIPNLDFDVADYGTEELIVADGVKSAPFHADIIYTPNALKTLEQVPDILKRLTTLEAAVASATSTTNE